MDDTTLYSRQELREQRERIQRSFLRTNTAIALVLAAVLGLALAAVLASVRASRNQLRAERAERDAREKLWDSYLVQARAARLSGQRGHRLEALTAVSNAAAFRASVELRNEAIAAFMCSDLEPEAPLHPVPLPHQAAFQFGLLHYVVATSLGQFTIYRTRDHAVVTRFGLSPDELPEGAFLLNFAFSLDGRHLIASYSHGFVPAWRIEDGALVWARHASPGRRLGGVTTSQDGRLCLTETLGGQSLIRLVDLSDGAEFQSLTVTGAVRASTLRPGTNQVALCYGTEVQLWNYEQSLHITSLFTPTPGLVPVWSRDGSFMAVANDEGTIYLQDLANTVFQSLIGHVEPLRTMVFSPDGEQLLSSSWDNTSRLWDTSSGRVMLTCAGDIGSEFSQDGRRIGYFKPGAGVGVWRHQQSPLLRSLQQWPRVRRGLRQFDLSPSGRWGLAVQSEGLFLWDFSSPAPVSFTPVTGVSAATFHPDERQVLLTLAGRLESRPILEAAPGGTASLGPPREIALPQGDRARFATLSLDGRSVLMDLADLGFMVLDLQGERPPVRLAGRQRNRTRFPPGTTTGSGRMAISPDGRWAAVAYGWIPEPGTAGPGKMAVWDAATGEVVFTMDQAQGSVFFSPDHRHLVVRSVDDCRLVRVGTWELDRRVPQDHLAGQVGTTAFSGGTAPLAVTRTRQLIALLDPEGGEELAHLAMPFAASAGQLRCARDGSLLAAAAPEGRIHLWNLDALRGTLAGLGLDWGRSPGPAPPAGNPAPRGFLAGHPARMIAGGFVGVALAVGSAFVVLRRHRQLIARFVLTEATVEKRDRQLELARLELMEAEKMKALGTLAAGIAHDFNNLLSVIRMSNQLIPRSRSPDETAEYVSAVEQAVLQGKTVVGSMLGYSRESDGDAAPCDACVVVEEAALLLSREFLSGIELNLNLDRTAPPLHVNKGRLQQALLNLVVNAAEAMRGSGRLTVSVATLAHLPELPHGRFAARPDPAARYVQVAVTDTGPGIAPEILGRVFEPFFTTKTAGLRKGTGLGLSVVHTIALRERFGLAVESTPGSGATFHLFLPGD